MDITENNHYICVLYFLNDTDRQNYLIEMYLACLKINMKHPENVDVETCPTRSSCYCHIPGTNGLVQNDGYVNYNLL